MREAIPTEEAVEAIAAAEEQSTAASASGLRKALAAIWKMFVAMVICQSLVGSILAVGWTYRLMRRVAVNQWWTKSRRHHQAIGFREFAAGEPNLRECAEWPNWVLEQRAARQASPNRWLRMAFASLGANLTTGLGGIFNVWVLTLPACVLWMFAWFAGWNNSFNKGYEQAFVGPLTGLLGIAMFITAMLYVPMAQARQAITGNFKSFYDFRRVRQVIRMKWFFCLLLAAGYALLSLPVSVLSLLPYFMGNTKLPILEMPPADQLKFLNGFYFFSMLIVFPAYVSLRVAAARIYAGGVLAMVRRGEWTADDLAGREAAAFEALGLTEQRDERERSLPARILLWTSTRAGRLTALVASLAVWFVFVAQIFISQFFHYQPGRGWWNQPLVQLPWIRNVPAELEAAVRNGE